jgi:hypothetical protein
MDATEDYERGKAAASAGITRIEELLKIPEDERGFDFGTINRAIEALHEELAQAKDESDERGLDIDILSQMLDEARTKRDQAQKWAGEWHRVAETICLLAGVSQGLGADEMASAFRDKWEELRAALDQAQKDAKDARALLRDAWPFVPNNRRDDLSTRIEAMLEKKP